MVQASWITTFLLLLLLSSTINVASCNNDQLKAVQTARLGLSQGRRWAKTSLSLHGLNLVDSGGYAGDHDALSDCVLLYEESAGRLARLISGETRSHHDARAWLSGALANHRACLDGLEGKGMAQPPTARNLTAWLTQALTLHAENNEPDIDENKGVEPTREPSQNGQNGVMLADWSPETSKADIVVAKDGSGDYTTVNQAVAALTRRKGTRRVVVHVKAGIYKEKVEIGRKVHNVMFVGDGIDKTVIASDRSVQDDSTTFNSATFGVSGDGFWARDITFENTAGPYKSQAVAMRVTSDLSVFYRCSFKGYQDTLYVLSNRQFFRNCHVYGTVDFIFGNAAVVFQNCDIYLRRRPMGHLTVITAQGRDTPEEATGISIHQSRVRPSPEISALSVSTTNFLGRPWRRYSRTVFMETDLDGLVDPRGWEEWRGNYALSTLYYAEYKNVGDGASTKGRVKWPGFHVLNTVEDAMPFTVNRFIQGHKWIPSTGVPFTPGI